MEKKLTFIETLTVEEFKALFNVSSISVRRNPQTSKLFMVFGTKTGAVARAGIPTKAMVSKVQTEDGEEFWLLHEQGEGGAPEVAKF